MKTSWKTSLFGALVGLAQVSTALYNGGIHIGHWGATDFTQVISGVSTLLLGLYAKDRDITGPSK